MKYLILFTVLALSIVLGSCGKMKPNVKYRVEGVGYEITEISVICNEFPSPEWVHGNPGDQQLNFEWVGIKQNKITIQAYHAENIGTGTIKLYADNKLIGMVYGDQPTLFVDLTKK